MLKNATRRVRRTARRIHIGPGVKSAANYTDTTAGGETADRWRGCGRNTLERRRRAEPGTSGRRSVQVGAVILIPRVQTECP